MFSFSAALGFVALASAEPGPRDYTGYTHEKYLEEFSKSYNGEESALRKGLFDGNMATIISHNDNYNSGKGSWWMSANQFVDWTPEEFQAIMGSGGERMPGMLSSLQSLPKHQLPKSVDWREQGVVTPVKNQGSCGSCWAFASTETVESAYAVATGDLLELAPQAYVSCMANPESCGGTGGCEGAIAELAFNYTADKGIPLSTDFPYTASDSACIDYTPAVKVGGYVTLPANDGDTLATALATVGPIAVSVAASQFSLYGGGVFDGCTGSTGAEINHAVQAVGYSSDYWLIRNSWGTSWGESGYIRLSRAQDGTLATDDAPGDGFNCQPYPKSIQVGGQCGVLSDSCYPTGASAVSSQTVV